MEQLYDICWDVKAGQQLKQIYQYLKENYSEITVKKVRKNIVDRIDDLRKFPERYPPEPLLSHRKENFRYITVKAYKIIYEFTGQEIRILFIYSTKQNPDVLTEFFE